MEKIWLKIIFVFILLNFCFLPVSAQRSNGLTVSGAVTVQEGVVDGAIIEMYRDGRRLDNYGIGPDGNYKVELNYNHEFVLIFSCPGNFPQKIVVDTKVPRQVLQANPLFPPFPVNIRLFTEIPGIERTFSENTVMKLYYSEQVDNFISDLYYNDAQIKHLIDQAILQSQLISREADYLAGLTKAELAELRREYDQLIKEAENEYKKEEFLKALDGYQAASKIFPKEQYPKDRIAEINDLLGLLMVADEMRQALAARLNELIKQADELFSAKKYQEARNAYNRALSVDANNRHAQQRIEEIAAILKQQQAEQEYAGLIKKADNSFRELLYVDAQNTYREALKLKENEPYPKQRIEEIDKILAQQSQNAERLKGYDQAIFQAEVNFEKQMYEKSISFFESALNHKPNDELATRRIEEIRELMNNLANRSMFDKLIKSADRAFQRKQYPEALADYEQAADLLPKEEYPQSQIAKINSIFAEEERLAAEAEAAEQARLAALQAEQDRQYSRAVSRGDSLFTLTDYNNSRTAYESALKVKPEETYPQQRINEIKDILAQLLSAQQAYDAAISRADRELGREAFAEAKSGYAEAQQAKPDETYPTEQIAKIDSIVEARARLAAEAEAAEQARLAALQAEQDRQYSHAISRGDSLFTLTDYNNSRTAYESALKVKPEETYPQQRINEIKDILAQLLSAQQAYDAAISRADRELGREAFAEAKSGYSEAQQAKPDEAYPAEQIAKIDSIVEARARLAAEAEAAEQARLTALQAEQDRQYSRAVSRGDSLFTLTDYDNSRTAYESALKIKPDETYPQQRINEIAAIFLERERLQDEYQTAIKLADGQFKNQDYGTAKTNYEKALEIKPDETYPKTQITESERLMAIQELDENYRETVLLADKFFREESWDDAKSEYEKALGIKSAENYPKSQLVKIENMIRQQQERILAEQRAAGDMERRMAEIEKRQQQINEWQEMSEASLNMLYGEYIVLADGFFDNKRYNVSRAWYYKAWDIKPRETYPPKRIDEINRLVRSLLLNQRDRDYQGFVDLADSTFRNNQLAVARGWYNRALTIKPNETYPKEQLQNISGLIEEQLAARSGEQFNALKQNAAEAMENKSYTVARFWYKKALTLRPDDKEVQEGLSKIEEELR